MQFYDVDTRARRLINTDPQRRCYNGAHFSSELVWTNWYCIDHKVSKDKAEAVVNSMKELNDYAVSQRGESARREFRIVEVK